jgi:membrane protease YdiL (CAAX protease family)
VTTHPVSTAPARIPSPRGAAWRTAVLAIGLAGAVALRVGLAGPAGVRSAPAGLAFSFALVALALHAGRGRAPGPPSAALRWGLAGGAVLCLVPLVVHLRTPGGPLPVADVPVWAGVVTAVAVAEEVLLRGVLWAAAEDAGGATVALVVTTVAFALLHVPLYGWYALPLDLAVGLLLGGLRMIAGGWTAPAVAHTVADLAGWWLR